MKKSISQLTILLVVTLMIGDGNAQVGNQSVDRISLIDKLGLNYFSFWDGPSIADGETGRNELGKPQDQGLSLFNLVSVTYKINPRYSFDLQNRFEVIHTEQKEFRFQGIRAGVSGKLMSGSRWTLNGAANTDLPELNGRDAQYRTTIFNPGLFAGLNYELSPRWNFYSILSPRIFFYKDDNAIEPEWKESGRSPGEKPRLVLAASPSVNYAIKDELGLRFGADLQFRQFVDDRVGTLRRWPTSVSAGPTLNFSKALNLYPYIMAWPFDGKKITAETTSIGMWLNGTVF